MQQRQTESYWQGQGITDAPEFGDAHDVRLASIVEHTSDAIIGEDLTGRIVSWNRAAERLFGYAADEVIGRGVALLVPPERPNEVPQLLERIARGEDVKHYETVRITKDGRRIDVSLTLSPIRNEDGRIIGASKIIRDICAHKRAEQELRRHADEIEDLYNNAPCGYHSLDARGVFTRINDTELKWLGYSREEVVGRMSFAELLTPDGLDVFTANFPVFKERGEIHDLEFDLTRKDGSTMPVLLSATAIKDAEGNFLASRSTIIDLTHRRRIEAELHSARAAAEAANEAKSAFLANMSHEIRTPMMAIIGYADLLLDPALSASDRLTNVNVIRRNADHLLAIINDILDLSKIEAREMKAEIIECSPCQVIYDVVSLMRVRAAEKNLQFKLEHDSVIPETIRTDLFRLRQILINLVGNAVKFTEAGWVKLAVRLERDDAGGPRLRFVVSDTGIGMNEEQAARLFKPFSQADGSMTRRFGGTGLGLAISQRLAEMLGGSIEVETAPERGSAFTLRIATGPLDGVRLLSDCREAVIAPETLIAHPIASVRLRGRVLLAEDGYDNRQLISHYLGAAGADVTCAENGRIACNLALEALNKGEPFDLIVMDMQMPELDGYGAASKLRSAGCEAPIVALTAHAMANDREKCLHAGCSDYLAKPVRRDVLIELVARHLGCDAANGGGAAGGSGAEDAPLVSDLTDESILQFLEAFVCSIPGKVAEIEEALEAGEMQTLGELLHQVKGSAGLFGFMPITDHAAFVEDQIHRNRRIESITHHVRELTDLMRRATVQSSNV